MCVVLESSSQGANGVKENKASLSFYISTLNSTFGPVLVEHTGGLGQQAADSSCSLLAVHRRDGWVGGENSINVESRRSRRGKSCFSCFTDDTEAARIAYKVRKDKRNPHGEFVL